MAQEQKNVGKLQNEILTFLFNRSLNPTSKQNVKKTCFKKSRKTVYKKTKDKQQAIHGCLQVASKAGRTRGYVKMADMINKRPLFVRDQGAAETIKQGHPAPLSENMQMRHGKVHPNRLRGEGIGPGRGEFKLLVQEITDCLSLSLLWTTGGTP